MTSDRELSTFWDAGGGIKVAWLPGSWTLDARRTEPSWWPPVARTLLAIAVAARRRSRHRS